MMFANRTHFSPARPIHATRPPCSAVSMSVVSCTFRPHRLDASLMLMSPSSILMYTGVSDPPVMISASSPARFNSLPKNPPPLESTIVPVSGDFVTNEWRPDIGAMPVSGPTASISGAERAPEAGSGFGSAMLHISATPSPLPPRKSFARSPGRLVRLIVPRSRSIAAMFPVQPCMSIDDTILYSCLRWQIYLTHNLTHTRATGDFGHLLRHRTTAIPAATKAITITLTTIETSVPQASTPPSPVDLVGIDRAIGVTRAVGAGVGGKGGSTTDNSTDCQVYGSFAMLSATLIVYVPTDAFSLA